MRPKDYTTIFAAFLLLVLCLTSCDSDDSFTTNPSARLTFESDTIRFDTVITTIGSSTKRFKVYNRNSEGVRLSSVALESGGSSGFRINVDGHSGSMLTDLEIMKKDSIFIFAEVTLPEQSSDKPVLVRDKILFTLESGVSQEIVLEALGQDVIFMYSPRISIDTEWTSIKPYVIYDSLIVDKGATLTLQRGVNLYFHSGAYVGVYGQLACIGTIEEPVVFRSDRTDKIFPYLPYDRMSAEWEGIILYPESGNNLFDNVDIHGGKYGIHCPLSTTNDYKYFIQNSRIHNMSGDCLRAYYCIGQVLNSEITNSGGNCVSLIGGSHNMVHTTIGQFYPFSAGMGSALYFTNVENDTIYPLHQANFYNCLITGVQTDEIVGNRIENNDAEFNALFDHCLINIKMTGKESDDIKAMFATSVNEIEGMEAWKKDSNGSYLEEYVWGRKNFLKTGALYIYDFGLTKDSRARGIGNGKYVEYCPLDRAGINRPSSNPDAGCYQYIDKNDD